MFVHGVDPLISSKSIYQLSVCKTTQAYISIIQPKKRSNTKSQYWYCDPSMILLRQLKDGIDQQWEFVACSTNGIKRQCHLDVFLEAGQMYCCIPWSCAVSCDHPFRFVTYSGSPVVVKSLHRATDCCNNDLDIRLIREFGLRTLFAELLMSNDGQHVHPITDASGMKGLVIGTYGETQSSFYVLSVNGSPDHYLSMRISSDNVTDGQFLCTSLNQSSNGIPMVHQDFDIPPLSQQFLLVVTASGTRKRTEQLKYPTFHYASTWVAASQSARRSTMVHTFGGSIRVCQAGQNALSLHCVSFVTAGYSGTIQSSFDNPTLLLGRVSWHG
jgi:hypothetical protein